MAISVDAVTSAADELIRLVHKLVEYPAGRFRCEDVISAISAFTGEAALRKAGVIDVDHHAFNPGQAVFSGTVNVILSGDRTEWREIPVTSIFGGLYHVLPHYPQPWPRESFPSVARVYEHFAAVHGRGKSDWGKAALSVPSANLPSEGMPPLRAAFELRRSVLGRWQKTGLSDEAVFLAAHVALLEIMKLVRPQIAPDIGLMIAFQTINAMAKTAPMLPKHMEEMASNLRG
jgi:hypothetical protein